MAGNVITLENYTTKLSKLTFPGHPGTPNFALVDIGSNGIRFSITSLSQSPPTARLLPCIYRERQGISLYDALHDSSPDAEPFVFPPQTIVAVTSSMARFRDICLAHAVPTQQICVFATEAMRTAHNRDEMLEAIQKASGMVVEMLSPTMESLFGAMGARSGFPSVKGLFMDLGGGSVQMTYVDSSDASYDALAAKAAQSMPFGAARLTEVLRTQSVAESTQKELQRAMQLTFDGLMAQFPALKTQAQSSDGITIYLFGGGFRGLGSILMHTHHVQPYPIFDIGGFTVPGEKFIQTKAILKANEQEGKVFGMSKRRRQQFPAIVMVAEALVKTVPRIQKVVFCSGGNREGVLFMKLPTAIRETDPLSLYPGAPLSREGASADVIVSVFSKCLPDGMPTFLPPELKRYIIRNIWAGIGNNNDANAAKALHAPISGLIAGLPGLTHETRAIISLIMVARWATDLSPIDRTLYDNLRHLIGAQLSFWCEYVGTVGRLFGMIFPTYPAEDHAVKESICMTASKDKLGKHGKRSGVKLLLRLRNVDFMDVNDDIQSMFRAVGKGLDGDQRVEMEFSEG